jgi:hypothetical protein
VFALFFQQGLGYSPLQSGLSVTPFAIGSTVSAALAGRLVSQTDGNRPQPGRHRAERGRAAGLAGACRASRPDPGPAAAGRRHRRRPGDLAEHDPDIGVRADQDSRGGRRGNADRSRLGTAVGTAVLAGILRAMVAASRGDFPDALSVVMLCSVGFILVAPVLAIGELRARRQPRSAVQLPEVTVAAPSEWWLRRVLALPTATR